MPVVFVRFPEATPGCSCPTCEEIREANRTDKRERNEVYQWSEKHAEEIGRKLTRPLGNVDVVRTDDHPGATLGTCPTCGAPPGTPCDAALHS